MPTSPLRRPFALVLSVILSAVLSLGAVSAAHAVPGPTLTGLAISTSSFDTSFSPGTTEYTATVPSTVSSLTITATADAGYTLSVYNGMSWLPAESGEAITASLRGGASATTNIFLVTVTDPDSATSAQYTMTVTRSAPPAPAYDPRLTSLAVSTGTLTPAFDPAVTGYSVEVPYATSSITVTATSGDTVRSRTRAAP